MLAYTDTDIDMDKDMDTDTDTDKDTNTGLCASIVHFAHATLTELKLCVLILL